MKVMKKSLKLSKWMYLLTSLQKSFILPALFLVLIFLINASYTIYFLFLYSTQNLQIHHVYFNLKRRGKELWFLLQKFNFYINKIGKYNKIQSW